MTFGAIHVLPPCFRVAFRSVKYPLPASLILRGMNMSEDCMKGDLQMSSLFKTRLLVHQFLSRIVPCLGMRYWPVLDTEWPL